MIFALAGGLLPIALILAIAVICAYFGDRKMALAIVAGLLAWEGIKALIAML